MEDGVLAGVDDADDNSGLEAGLAPTWHCALILPLNDHDDSTTRLKSAWNFARPCRVSRSASGVPAGAGRQRTASVSKRTRKYSVTTPATGSTEPSNLPPKSLSLI
jgi:hypothetical protein